MYQIFSCAARKNVSYFACLEYNSIIPVFKGEAVMFKQTTIFQKELILKAVKITLGAVLAIALCSLIGLKYSASAGIITILSIQNTKRETMRTAADRTLAFGCALIISFLCYRILGFTVLAFGVYLLGFSFLCLMMGWAAAISMDSVLITHFLSEGSMTPALIINEVLLFGIGTGIGILLNLHLHSKQGAWKRKMDEADSAARGILQRMAERVRSLDRTNYDDSCFVLVNRQLEEAKTLALTNLNNTLFSASLYELDYVEMRKAQCLVLRNIYHSICLLAFLPVQAQTVASFLEQISAEYDMKNDAQGLIAGLNALLLSMQREPLPVSREEFESRAVLFYLLKQLEEFLTLKQSFAKKYGNKSER